MPILGEHTAPEIKLQLTEEIEKKLGMKEKLNPDLIRLRERVSNRLVRIYRDVPMKTQALFERKMISCEILDKPEKLKKNENMLYIRIFNPEEWNLSDRFEIIVDKTDNLEHLYQTIIEKNKDFDIGVIILHFLFLILKLLYFFYFNF